MWRRITTAFWMLLVIGVLGFCGKLGAKYEGCAESLVAPPKPTCNLGETVPSPRVVIAGLVRGDPQWLLARDDDRGALAISGELSVFVFPDTEQRDPETALADFVVSLPPDVQTALQHTPAALIWLGRTHDPNSKVVRYSAWDPGLSVGLFHDILTPTNHCFARVPPSDDPQEHINRWHLNERLRRMAKLDASLVGVLRKASRPLYSDESADRIRLAAPRLHKIATVTLRETYLPWSGVIIVVLVLGFYWWAASAGKDDLFELAEDELKGDGALVSPGRLDVRLLSHGLLHKDLKHLLNNLFAIYIGCVILEPAIGSARALIVFLVGVIGGGLARLMVKRPGLTVGASGGAFALQTAALVLLLNAGSWYLPSERSGLLIYLGIQLGFNLVLSFLPGISMSGHIGGALAGFLLTITGVVMIGHPTLDGGPESALSVNVAWGIAGFLVVLWVVAGVAIQWGRIDLDPDYRKPDS